MKAALILFAVAIVFLCGCTPQLPQTPTNLSNETQAVSNETQAATEVVVPTDGVSSVVAANNQFAFELYSKLSADQGNIFLSPYSISTALAMTYEGAEGKTADEIQSVFHFPKDSELRRTAFASVQNSINQKNPGYTLSTANALWVQKSYPLLQNYTDIVEKYYNGKATNLDFIKKTQESRNIINSWVAEQTSNKITNLIQSLSVQTRLVITNAVYFKGTWLKEFDPKKTTERNFWITPGKTTKANMMSSSDEFNYAETSDMQVLELPYDGEKLSMLILLPKGDIGTIEESLNAKMIGNLTSRLEKQKVNVFLPKFRFEESYELNGPLAKLGMPTAFTDKADFSGMDGAGRLYIDQVAHKAFVEVNEEGTEAAAATAVVVIATAIRDEPVTPTFNADHPFIFIIQDKETGNILFLGRVSDPIVAAAT